MQAVQQNAVLAVSDLGLGRVSDRQTDRQRDKRTVGALLGSEFAAHSWFK